MTETKFSFLDSSATDRLDMKKAEEAFKQFLIHMGLDITDENLKGTPERVTRMYRELFSGLYDAPPKVTSFPYVSDAVGDSEQPSQQVIVVGPIQIRSTCAHHFMPIQGHCHVAVFADASVLGLSKYARIIHYIAARPQLQEDLTLQIAKAFEELGLEHVAVYVEAKHGCMSHRGVREHGSVMKTMLLEGDFKKAGLRSEFLSLIK